MALITINIRGKDVVINPDTITVLKTVPISKDKWGIQLDWLPKNSAILTVNQDNVFNSKGEADTALQLIRQEIEENSSSKVDTTIYRAAGSLTALEIVNDLLVEENLGNVYNITETFTTTIDFVEGVGIEFAAGTNIVIIDSGNEVYKFDVLTGFIDTSSFLTSVPQANENNIGGIKATTRNNTNDTDRKSVV